VTFSVKDNIAVKGSPMRAGSQAYFEVPDEDAWVVARMRALGANLLGQTNLHEFATGFETPAKNPHDPQRTPGGSSGGAGIAAATGMGLVAFGTDTRASIRNPACYCGISGHRPTQGLIPTAGLLPLGFTMDTVGPLAPTMADVGLVVWMLAPGGIELPGSIEGLVVGVPETALEETDEPVRQGFAAALDLLRQAGMEVVDIDAPGEDEIQVANAAGLLISRCEGTTFHHHLGADRSLYWDETRDQFDAAELVPAHVYIQAQRVREQLRRRWAERFRTVDLVATPTSPVVPPLLAGAGVGMLSLSRTTILWSLLGTPTLSVPAPTVMGSLPVGLQIAGPGGMDGRVIAAALAFEQARVSRGGR
jgi:aspartyl-tRNA(Asn)/glutamyl-tRNA(Gln) amidotransferase subunit A